MYPVEWAQRDCCARRLAFSRRWRVLILIIPGGGGVCERENESKRGRGEARWGWTGERKRAGRGERSQRRQLRPRPIINLARYDNIISIERLVMQGAGFMIGRSEGPIARGALSSVQEGSFPLPTGLCMCHIHMRERKSVARSR